MKLDLPKQIKTFYWHVFSFPFVLIAYHHLVHEWQLEQYGFDELEDVGTLFFIFGFSACEVTLVTVFLWSVVDSVTKLLHLSK
ncbi:MULTISPECIES: hypothetical protein [unclassified Exiguobacterium]|uniref:hypothetical protein n=1 Tax=unclassified Exiguobacterium TaxID=2644629 RepID=UPI001038C6DF|nr:MULTISPECIES: hypothetical protein [unclassified Exiguobacterium]TCI65205.1 hypothetical protein EVJ21_01005 [Exiguobacterium sp. SH0S2]TCI80373.1 hypothetical protein EVJ20_03410 [Exiguobacterium sp. SH0S1]